MKLDVYFFYFVKEKILSLSNKTLIFIFLFSRWIPFFVYKIL